MFVRCIRFYLVHCKHQIKLISHYKLFSVLNDSGIIIALYLNEIMALFLYVRNELFAWDWFIILAGVMDGSLSSPHSEEVITVRHTLAEREGLVLRAGFLFGHRLMVSQKCNTFYAGLFDDNTLLHCVTLVKIPYELVTL